MTEKLKELCDSENERCRTPSEQIPDKETIKGKLNELNEKKLKDITDIGVPTIEEDGEIVVKNDKNRPAQEDAEIVDKNDKNRLAQEDAVCEIVDKNDKNRPVQEYAEIVDKNDKNRPVQEDAAIVDKNDKNRLAQSQGCHPKIFSNKSPAELETVEIDQDSPNLLQG